MSVVSFVRRALDGPIVTAFAAAASGVPLSLTLGKPQNPSSLRHELTDAIALARILVGVPKTADGGLGRTVPDRLPDAFTEMAMTPIVDLADVVGVTNSKSGVLFTEIAPNADPAYLMRVHRCSSPEELLQSGLSSAFRDIRQRNPTIISATRFGTRGPLYFCTIDGSHRIAAARAEFIRRQQPCPLAIDVRAVEPVAAVVHLLEEWDVVVAAMPQTAITALFDGPDRRRGRSMRAAMFGDDVLAVVRRRSRAWTVTDALARAGHLFSLRAFLIDSGCRMSV